MTNKNDLNLSDLLHFDKPHALYEKFHEKTKLKKNARGISPANYPKSWNIIEHKGYSRFQEIMLPKPRLPHYSSLSEFSQKTLSLNHLSSFLYFSMGQKSLSNPYAGRFYPSAGKRYPIEIYVISLTTELEKGIYHYYFKHHSLEKLHTIKDFSFSKHLIHRSFKNAS